MRRMLLVIMLGMLVVPFGCGGGGGTDDGGEYAEAIPDTEMLALTFEDAETAQEALELASIEAPLPGNPAAFKDHAKKVMEDLNALLEETHAEIEGLFADVEPVAWSKGALECKVWEADGEKVHWRLASCVKDKGAKKYWFVLKGRPLASTADADYKVVFAGEGKILPKYNEKKRGSGVLGYNFDNLNALNGRPVAGKLGIGYKAEGKARHLIIGLFHVKGPDMTQDLHGIYRYKRVIGSGGHFSFVGVGDFLKKEADKLVLGQDTLEEFVRAAIGWKATGEARTVLAACGGTVGEGECVRLAQCWSKDETVDFEEQEAGDGKDKTPKWDKTKCADIPFAADEPPSEEDFEPPTATDADAAAPVMPEPND